MIMASRILCRICMCASVHECTCMWSRVYRLACVQLGACMRACVHMCASVQGDVVKEMLREGRGSKEVGQTACKAVACRFMRTVPGKEGHVHRTGWCTLKRAVSISDVGD